MTINQRTTLLVSTGAMVNDAFCAAAPAQAADAYVALSYSLQSKVSGMAAAATKDAAQAESLSNCAANGGNQCVTYVSILNSCAAIAVGTDPALHQGFSTATNFIVEMALKRALSKNGGGCHRGVGMHDQSRRRLTAGLLTRDRLTRNPTPNPTAACAQ